MNGFNIGLIKRVWVQLTLVAVLLFLILNYSESYDLKVWFTRAVLIVVYGYFISTTQIELQPNEVRLSVIISIYFSIISFYRITTGDIQFGIVILFSIISICISVYLLSLLKFYQNQYKHFVFIITLIAHHLFFYLLNKVNVFSFSTDIFDKLTNWSNFYLLLILLAISMIPLSLKNKQFEIVRLRYKNIGEFQIDEDISSDNSLLELIFIIRRGVKIFLNRMIVAANVVLSIATKCLDTIIRFMAAFFSEAMNCFPCLWIICLVLLLSMIGFCLINVSFNGGEEVVQYLIGQNQLSYFSVYLEIIFLLFIIVFLFKVVLVKLFLKGSFKSFLSYQLFINLDVLVQSIILFSFLGFSFFLAGSKDIMSIPVLSIIVFIVFGVIFSLSYKKGSNRQSIKVFSKRETKIPEFQIWDMPSFSVIAYVLYAYIFLSYLNDLNGNYNLFSKKTNGSVYRSEQPATDSNINYNHSNDKIDRIKKEKTHTNKTETKKIASNSIPVFNSADERYRTRQVENTDEKIGRVPDVEKENRASEQIVNKSSEKQFITFSPLATGKQMVQFISTSHWLVKVYWRGNLVWNRRAEYFEEGKYTHKNNPFEVEPGTYMFRFTENDYAGPQYLYNVTIPAGVLVTINIDNYANAKQENKEN